MVTIPYSHDDQLNCSAAGLLHPDPKRVHNIVEDTTLPLGQQFPQERAARANQLLSTGSHWEKGKLYCVISTRKLMLNVITDPLPTCRTQQQTVNFRPLAGAVTTACLVCIDGAAALLRYDKTVSSIYIFKLSVSCCTFSCLLFICCRKAHQVGNNAADCLK